MKLHIIMHESFEAPGAILVWAQKNGFEASYSRVYQKEVLPKNTKGFDFLIVMGGPQSPATTPSECTHFDSKAEIDFIAKAISDKKFVLGICLGAQLIGEALGAKFSHSPNREIGVFDLVLTSDGKKDPVFSKFPERFSVGHWHGDMPGITPESKILATSEGCPRQIVRYSDKVYGFQCHFEFTPDSVEGMIKNSQEELENYKGLPFIEDQDKLRKNNYKTMNDMLFKFLDYINLAYLKEAD